MVELVLELESSQEKADTPHDATSGPHIPV